MASEKQVEMNGDIDEMEDLMQKIIGRSCKEETAEAVEGILSGEIPKWISGSFLRNGPGMMEIGDDKYNHYFDGLALLHCFNIKDGKVLYRNKFLRSESYKKNIKANRIVVSEFGTAAHPDPCATLFDRFRSTFQTTEFTDNDNVNIFKIGDSYYAATEANCIRKIDPDTVDTKEQIKLSDYIAVNTATAHPHTEPDGTVYNLGNSYSGLPAYNIIKFPPSQNGLESFEKATVLCKIPCSHSFYPSYYHSFGMSENYFIIAEQSLVLNLPKLMWQMFKKAAYNESLQWEPNQKVKFIVVEKSTGKILPDKFVANPFMTFHHANAYEDNGHLVVDLSAYANGDVITALRKSNSSNVQEHDSTMKQLSSEIRRYVLPLSANSSDVAANQPNSLENLVKLEGTSATAQRQNDGSILCVYEHLSPTLDALELIQINYDAYNGKKYQYVYGYGRELGLSQLSLIKVDTKTKTHISWNEVKKYPTEPVFVAAPNSQSEDDGILLSSLLHEDNENKVTLLVLDAKTMKELGRTEFEAKSSVTSSFHGPFVPSK